MSMEINGSYSQYKTDYPERLKEEQEKAKGAEKAEETKRAGGTEKGQNDVKASERMPALQDEYISSEKSGVKPSGLYRLGQDGEGKKKVFFDDPKRSVEKCTVNTDRVDMEIKKLKEKRQQLEQQLTSASGDERKVKELEKKLAQVENELSRKDNDTYRRQNASVFEE